MKNHKNKNSSFWLGFFLTMFVVWLFWAIDMILSLGFLENFYDNYNGLVGAGIFILIFTTPCFLGGAIFWELNVIRLMDRLEIKDPNNEPEE